MEPMEKLPGFDSLPTQKSQKDTRKCLELLLTSDPNLYSDLFLDGLSNHCIRAFFQDNFCKNDEINKILRRITLDKGLLITKKEYRRYKLYILESCHLICTVNALDPGGKEITDIYRIMGLFQVYPIVGKPFNLKEPLFLMTDFPGFTAENSVFPTYFFRTQFEFHVKNLQRLLYPGASVLDIGTGSGAYALLCAKLFPGPGEIVGIDINPRALQMAKFNQVLNGIEHNITFKLEDLLNFKPKRKYDIVISNPPYVPLPGYYSHTFYRWAYAGPDGLKFLKAILEGAIDYVNDSGVISLVTYSLGTEKENLFEEHLGYSLRNLKIAKLQKIFPPMWTKFNPMWFTQNPIHIDDLYLRVRQFTALDHWKDEFKQKDQEFVSNLYVEIRKVKKKNSEQNPVRDESYFQQYKRIFEKMANFLDASVSLDCHLFKKIQDRISLGEQDGLHGLEERVRFIFNELKNIFTGQRRLTTEFSGISGLMKSFNCCALKFQAQEYPGLIFNEIIPLGRRETFVKMKTLYTFFYRQKHQGKNRFRAEPFVDLLFEIKEPPGKTGKSSLNIDVLAFSIGETRDGFIKMPDFRHLIDAELFTPFFHEVDLLVIKLENIVNKYLKFWFHRSYQVNERSDHSTNTFFAAIEQKIQVLKTEIITTVIMNNLHEIPGNKSYPADYIAKIRDLLLYLAPQLEVSNELEKMLSELSRTYDQTGNSLKNIYRSIEDGYFEQLEGIIKQDTVINEIVEFRWKLARALNRVEVLKVNIESIASSIFLSQVIDKNWCYYYYFMVSNYPGVPIGAFTLTSRDRFSTLCGCSEKELASMEEICEIKMRKGHSRFIYSLYSMMSLFIPAQV